LKKSTMQSFYYTRQTAEVQKAIGGIGKRHPALVMQCWKDSCD